ncbi:hypothetical protein F5Y15DRAFT_19578 [Xylariaceae sp. FL0016]|nr:hypothetical protein F5Y15DRAFT_19578 [Xylariaceae sp. FL0016]
MPTSQRSGHGMPPQGQKPREASPPPAYTENEHPKPPPYSGFPPNERTPLIYSPNFAIRDVNITIPNTNPASLRNAWISIRDHRRGTRRWNTGSLRCSGRVLKLTTFVTLAFLFLVVFMLLSMLAGLPLGIGWRTPALPAPPPTYTVAIIGAGPGGIAAAQQLYCSPHKGNIRFNITVYESKPVIGGVLSVSDANESLVYPYEDPTQDPITPEDIAGRALLWHNALFTGDSERLLGDKVEFYESDSEQVQYSIDFGLGSTIANTYRPYSKTPTTSWLGLIWRYGSSVWRAGSMANDGNRRSKIVNAPITPGTDIAAILKHLGHLHAAQKWATDVLDARRISGAYRSEILDPQVRRAHAQGITDVNGLALLLAAAQEDTGNAFATNEASDAMLSRLEQIVRALDIDLRTSTRVTGLRRQKVSKQRHSWLVEHEGSADGARVEAFDKVILAAYDEFIVRSGDVTQVYTTESVGDPETQHRPHHPGDHSESPYKPTFATFFTATVDWRLLAGTNGASQILFLDSDASDYVRTGVHEAAFVREVPRWDQHAGAWSIEYLYRVLSEHEVTKYLLPDRNITWSFQTRIDNAYPYLWPLTSFPSFTAPDPELDGIWWTSVINRVASTVDLNWLAGKVIAEDLIKEVKRA